MLQSRLYTKPLKKFKSQKVLFHFTSVLLSSDGSHLEIHSFPLTKNTDYITPIHALLLRACIKSMNYRAALPLLQDRIHEPDSSFVFLWFFIFFPSTRLHVLISLPKASIFLLKWSCCFFTTRDVFSLGWSNSHVRSSIFGWFLFIYFYFVVFFGFLYFLRHQNRHLVFHSSHTVQFLPRPTKSIYWFL